MPLHLSINAARALHLAAQGMRVPQRRKATKADALDAIRRMALLQIDTIHVVARSPYLVLWSRLGDYDPKWLDELLAEGALFEYWAHEACFVPTEDYGQLRHRMIDPSAMGWKYPSRWLAAHKADIERIVDHIREHGPVRSSDFERREGKGGGWWDWKPEKRHLEVLFTTGRLMVAKRHNFQRIYDLTERVLPNWRDERDLPSAEAARTKMIRRSCEALGIVKAGWVADYYRLRRGKYDADLHALVDTGELIPARIEGWKHDVFIHRSLSELIDDAASDKLIATTTALLSPFDPIVWDRKRAAELFDFDYRIECYTPAPKRQYGYFVLPILNRGKLVGRLDAKAHRKEGVFEVKALYLEPGIRESQRLATDICTTLQRCAQWHGTAQVQLNHGPESIRAGLCERQRR